LFQKLDFEKLVLEIFQKFNFKNLVTKILLL